MLRFLFLLFCLHTSLLRAEQDLVLSIVNLSFYSDTVVSAKYITHSNNLYTFALQKVDDTSSRYAADTIQLHYQHRDRYEGYSVGYKVEDAEKLILYLRRDKETEHEYVVLDKFIHVTSDYKNKWTTIKRGVTYSPETDLADWRNLMIRIEQVHKRMQKVKRLKNISDPVVQNKQLFKWISSQIHTFDKNCHLYDDCGWGFLEYEIFEWISKNNIAKDTWKASELMRQVESERKFQYRRLTDVNGTSFQTFHDIEFLLEIGTDSEADTMNRIQALSFLQQACRLVYESPSSSDNKKIALQKQTEIRRLMIPLLKEEAFKFYAFPIFKRMTNPYDYALRYRIDLSNISDLIEIYKIEKPGYLKSDMAEFIAGNCSDSTWYALSKSDANIFVDIYSLHIDTIKRNINFHYRNRNGNQSISKAPEVIIEDIISGHNMSRNEVAGFTTPPYYPYKSMRTCTIHYDNLPIGEYLIHLEGFAGENNQYKWKTESLSFQIK